MEKVKVKKVKLKEPIKKILNKVIVILVLFLSVFIYYNHQIASLKAIGYSKESSKYILFHGKKKYILSLGENKTLNEAFKSSYYKEENIEKYQNIKYVDQENFIQNINALIDKGYSVSNINMIFEHGNSKDVEEFAKRDKVKYLEEFYSVSYAKLKNYDRYLAYSDETGEDDAQTVLVVNLDLDKEDYTDYQDAGEFSTSMLVNKHRKLSEDFEPNDLTKIESMYTNGDDVYASKLAINAFKKMYNDAEKEGYGLVINSAYRSYQDQEELSNYYRNLYGDNYVKRYVSKPGFSEHQTGLGLDIGSKTTSIFANSKEFEWMLDNAYKYGFILRFPKKYVDITGINSEPWHYRYVGVDIATYMHEHEMPFEKYYAMFLDD